MKTPATAPSDDEADRFEGTPHPRCTTTFIGNSDRESELLEAYRKNRLPHAIILGGPLGVGKATLAWRLARFLIANPDHRSAGVVEAPDLSVAPGTKAASEIASLSHPDVVLLRRELNEKTKRFFTEIRADDVRRVIGLFQRGAGAGGYRICIVDSADDLNRSSANALLKLIEEPPPLSLFLLVAHRPGLVIPTIRSRARLVRLAPLQPPEIEQVVGGLGEPWSAMPASERQAAAQGAQGSVREALRLLEHHALELDQTVGRLLDGLPALDWRGIHRLADRLTGRDGEAAYETIMQAIYGWIARGVDQRSGQRLGSLMPLADLWERMSSQAREADALNLDKRSLVLGIFAELASAVQASSR